MKQLAQSLADMFGARVGYQDAEGKHAVASSGLKCYIEVTDTFGHEPNYSWVKRFTLDNIDGLTNYALVRRVKNLIGWNGCRCQTVNYGDMIELRPYGACQVAFITWGE